MANTSSVPTVAARVKTLLETAATSILYEGRAAEVYDGYPARDAGWSYFAIGDVTDWDREYPTHKAGRKARQETYVLNVRIAATRPGQQSTAARNAAIEMVDEIDDMLADDPGIGLESTYPTLVLELMDGDLNTTVDDTGEGWRATVNARIAVGVRLS